MMEISTFLKQIKESSKGMGPHLNCLHYTLIGCSFIYRNIFNNIAWIEYSALPLN